jgi:site-specific DNA recombinase
MKNATTVVRAALYARYSTEKQNRASIEDQVRECSEYAEKAGWTIAHVYKDEGISGAATGNRPGFLAMMAAAEAGEFKVLLVMDLSRLSRNQGDLPKATERLCIAGYASSPYKTARTLRDRTSLNSRWPFTASWDSSSAG